MSLTINGNQVGLCNYSSYVPGSNNEIGFRLDSGICHCSVNYTDYIQYSLSNAFAFNEGQMFINASSGSSSSNCYISQIAYNPNTTFDDDTAFNRNVFVAGQLLASNISNPQLDWTFNTVSYTSNYRVNKFHEDLFENNPRDMHVLFTEEKVSFTGQFLKQCFSLRDTHLGVLTG